MREVAFLEVKYLNWKKLYSKSPIVKRLDARSILVWGIFFDTISFLNTRTNALESEKCSQTSATEDPIWDEKQFLADSFSEDRIWQTPLSSAEIDSAHP